MRERFPKVRWSTARLAPSERFHPLGSSSAPYVLLGLTRRILEVTGVPIARLGPFKASPVRLRALLAPLARHRAARAREDATRVRREGTRVTQTPSPALSALQASVLKINQRPSAMPVPRGNFSSARGKSSATTANAESTRLMRGASLARIAQWGTTQNSGRRIAF